ncbi:hypothetical protein [Tateyamaria omphalii]|uniref:Autotransporter domain-containing protein n=1 Tax=Tateyamaria omphalii TaxID=299262 RepID=A0A1P8MTJ1_9RHOB|nr:hypothetical protein [Tateyamaria omphalii]APX11279.1 hypothetical protein BWR18_05965 [Tateyamaria omphalii]
MNKTYAQTAVHAEPVSLKRTKSALRYAVLVLAALICGSGIEGHAQADAAKTEQLMFQLQIARMNRLIRHQPDLSPFLSGAGSGALNADIKDDKGTLTFSSGVDRRLWARANGRWDEDGLRMDKYGFGAMGVHVYVAPTLIVGGMIEADYLAQAGATSDRKGMGAMAGSYFLARNANHPLFFDGRLLVGKASDGIRLSGQGTGQPDTRRGLAQLRLSGQLRYDVTTLTPNILVSHAVDDVSSTQRGARIGQSLSMQHIRVGLDFRQTMRHMNGARFIIKGGGAVSDTSTRRYGYSAFLMPVERKRNGRVNLGFSYVTDAGGTLEIDSFVDGLGGRARQNYGLKAGFDIRF